jgi:sulfatase maturation enzyme AslB (radical SAM superfamily)
MIEILNNRVYKEHDVFVIWHPSHYCNYNCHYCYLKNDHQIDTTISHEVKQDETIDFLKYVASQTNGKTRELTIYRGEPTLSIDFPKVVSELYSNWDFQIETNLSKPLSYFQNLNEIDKDKKISYHVYVHYSQIENFEEFYTKVNFLIENKYNVVIRSVPDKDYYKEITDLFERFYQKYDNVYVLNFPMSSARSIDYEIYQRISLKYPDSDILLKINGKIYKQRDYITRNNNDLKGVTCNCLSRYITITTSGNLYHCPSDAKERTNKICNIYQDDYKQIELFKQESRICPYDRCRSCYSFFFAK